VRRAAGGGNVPSRIVGAPFEELAALAGLPGLDLLQRLAIAAGGQQGLAGGLFPGQRRRDRLITVRQRGSGGAPDPGNQARAKAFSVEDVARGPPIVIRERLEAGVRRRSAFIEPPLLAFDGGQPGAGRGQVSFGLVLGPPSGIERGL
jgi:hypothetical protein